MRCFPSFLCGKLRSMESLRELYRIGYGPSSSHTMGPRSACEMFISSHPEAKTVKAELYGSLAATGKGHLTDHAIREVFSAHGINAEIKWFPDEFKPYGFPMNSRHFIQMPSR